MNTPPASMLVFVGEGFACIRIIGRANFNSSIDFKRLVNELLLKGLNYFVLDLSECALMDSTFLGVLAGFGLKLNPAQKPDSPIELFNPNARIAELLENLGVLHLFQLRQADPAPALPNGSSETKVQALGQHSREEIAGTCLEAHKTLMALNPANVTRFKDVTQFLAEDLQKLKQASPQ